MAGQEIAVIQEVHGIFTCSHLVPARSSGHQIKACRLASETRVSRRLRQDLDSSSPQAYE